jgi:hypothetical protein
MRYKLRTTLLLVVAVVAALVVSTISTVTTTRPAKAAGGGLGTTWPIDGYGPNETTDNVILKWDERLLESIRANPKATGPTITARAIGVLHTATYDAWAAYDPVAVGTRLLGSLRRPAAERTTANKNKAISYAAYRTLVDLFPSRASIYSSYMSSSLGYDPNDTSTDTTTPQGVGNVAAQAVLDFRHADGSNQLGTDPNGTPGVAYSDTTIPHWTPVNQWNQLNNPGHWQPLCVPTAAGLPPSPPDGTCPTTNYVLQNPLSPHWGHVTSFALDPTTHYPPLFPLPGPPMESDGTYSHTEIATALNDTSNLSDVEKMKAEYWADGPKSEFPPGHAAVFAQALSRMRHDTLDQDAKLFFALGNAVMDASIAAWEAKYQFDCVRPITAIRSLYANTLITSWLGPYKGYGKVLGKYWLPYQDPTVVTPPFPEYVSGHSTFSAAGETVMVAFFGTNNFGAKVTIKAGSSKFEPRDATHVGTPAKDVVLSWKTLTDASDEAGWSRRWGGIHFESGDQQGRALGRLAGYDVWTKAQDYFNGTATATI